VGTPFLAALVGWGCTLITDEDFEWRLDADGDGLRFDLDCDDDDAHVGGPASWYPDSDDDGWGAADGEIRACTAPPGTVATGGDCDDRSALVHPEAREWCDGVDNNCDGAVDVVVQPKPGDLSFIDADGDGYGDPSAALACDPGAGASALDGDCDDADPAVHPNAEEVCDGVDNDCDGAYDPHGPTWYADADQDGYGVSDQARVLCQGLPGWAAESGDCDDDDPAVNPGAPEQCNDIDDDCDGIVDETVKLQWYADRDADGYGSGSGKSSCTAIDDRVTADGDCDDSDPDVHPGALEVCGDGLDNDCDGDDGEGTWYFDGDRDGVGIEEVSTSPCAPDAYWSRYPGDCTDEDPLEPAIVDGTTGSPSGIGTMGDPVDTIAGGLALGRSCVAILPGTYAEAVEVPASVRSLLGLSAGAAVIDPGGAECAVDALEGCSPAVTVLGGDVELRDLVIRGGTGFRSSSVGARTCFGSATPDTCTVTTYRYLGGGIFLVGSTVRLVDVRVEENIVPRWDVADTGAGTQDVVVGYGGGIALFDSDVEAQGLLVHANSGQTGGGIYLDSGASLVATASRVTRNRAAEGAGLAIDDGALDLVNAVIDCNVADDGAGALSMLDFGAGTATLDFTSILANEASTGGAAAIAVGYDSAVAVADSVVHADTAEVLLVAEGASTLSWSAIFNGSGRTAEGAWTADGATIDTESLLYEALSCDADLEDDDFNVPAASAARDAADPDAGLDPDGTAPDMGARGGPGGAW
jgi:hypothetical protein